MHQMYVLLQVPRQIDCSIKLGEHDTSKRKAQPLTFMKDAIVLRVITNLLSPWIAELFSVRLWLTNRSKSDVDKLLL